jgi:hypothetical protein
MFDHSECKVCEDLKRIPHSTKVFRKTLNYDWVGVVQFSGCLTDYIESKDPSAKASIKFGHDRARITGMTSDFDRKMIVEFQTYTMGEAILKMRETDFLERYKYAPMEDPILKS